MFIIICITIKNNVRMIDESNEFIFFGIGAILGAFLGYKITPAPLLLFGILVSNALLIDTVGSFFLGTFSVLSSSLNLDSRYSFPVAIGFCGSQTMSHLL